MLLLLGVLLLLRVLEVVLVLVLVVVLVVVLGVLLVVTVLLEELVGAVDVADVLETYVMHEQAELTRFTSPPQLPKSVGIADASVVVLARNLGQNSLASSAKRLSVISR